MSMNSSTLAFATVVLFAVGAQLRRKQQRDSRAKAAMERTLLRFNRTLMSCASTGTAWTI